MTHAARSACGTEDCISPSLRREAYLEDEAIKRCLAIPPNLRRALDRAPATGEPPTVTAFAQPDEYTLPPHWDGCVDGEPIFFAEAMLWCTLRDRYGWGIPAAETMPVIDRFCATTGRIIDVGAGTGYWAAVIQARGIDVTAVDKHPKRWRWSASWFDVQQADGVETIIGNPDIPVLMSWPDPQGLGRTIAHAMRPGTILLRCGPRAVTGCDAFNAALDQCFTAVDSVPVAAASGSADALEVLVRNDLPVSQVEVTPRQRAVLRAP